MHPYGASYFVRVEIGQFGHKTCVQKSIKMVMNGVPVAPHGLILGENEAAPSKKLFKHLPDLKTAINIKNNGKNSRSTAPAAGILYIAFGFLA